MRRIARVILAGLTLLSLLLSLGTVAVWLRSYHTADDFEWAQEVPSGIDSLLGPLRWRRYKRLTFIRGAVYWDSHLTLVRLIGESHDWTHRTRDPAQVFVVHRYMIDTGDRATDWDHGGLSYSLRHGVGGRWSRTVVLPFAYLTLLLLAPPTIWLLLWLRRWIHRQSFQLGRCATCGYDLRATRHRCPECGAVATEGDRG